MIEQRLKQLAGGVLRNFQEEINSPSARVVLQHQLEISLDSIILADYSVRVLDANGEEMKGVIFYKTNHEDNKFKEIQFSINKDTFNIE